MFPPSDRPSPTTAFTPAAIAAREHGTVQVQCSPGFTEWLRAAGISLAFTTYQTNRLFLVGVGEGGRVAAFERLFDRPMGLAADGTDLWLATRHQLWRLSAIPGETLGHPHDRVYVPVASRFTGEVDTHDLAIDADGRLLFVNTLYSCVATVADDGSFTPSGGRRSSRPCCRRTAATSTAWGWRAGWSPIGWSRTPCNTAPCSYGPTCSGSGSAWR